VEPYNFALQQSGAAAVFSVPIIRRRVKIDFENARASDWMKGSKDYEYVLNSISFLFPAGETFFCNSIQNYMERITDPKLKEQAREFIYQEAMHTKEHMRSNRELLKSFPHGAVMDRIARGLLSFSRATNPKATQLATTCALEHFTALFADTLLRRQERFLSISDPAFAALWLWHAVEETEHKAVAFDVYTHCVGKGWIAWLHRVIVMVSVSLWFLAGLGAGFAIIKWKEGRARRKSGAMPSGTADAPAGKPSVRELFAGFPAKLYFDYYRPSFHPWNHQNAELIDKWREVYATFGEAPEAPKPAAT
jgi:predicted metal-dependent hydrolase